MRSLPPLKDRVVLEIMIAWREPHPPWAQKRLSVAVLLAQRMSTVAQIMEAAKVSRQTVFTYRDKLKRGGLTELLMRRKSPGRPRIIAAQKCRLNADGNPQNFI